VFQVCTNSLQGGELANLFGKNPFNSIPPKNNLKKKKKFLDESSHPPTHGRLYLDLEGWKYKPGMARRRSPAWNVSLAGC
jgi:hypothetical protein